MKKLLLCLLLVPVVAMGTGRGVWLDVPYVRQEREGCGSASLAMVLQYWSEKGVKISAERMDADNIQREIYSKAAHGIHAADMEAYLRESRFSPAQFHGEWIDLRNHIEKGRPLIAAIQPGARVSLHYVVVVGLDRADEAILLNDPERGKLIRVGRAEFEKEWERTDNWTLLAVPRSLE